MLMKHAAALVIVFGAIGSVGGATDGTRFESQSSAQQPMAPAATQKPSTTPIRPDEAVGRAAPGLGNASGYPTGDLTAYLAFLRSETEAHREVINDFYALIWNLVIGFAFVSSGLLLWAWNRARNEITGICRTIATERLAELVKAETEKMRLIREEAVKTAGEMEALKKDVRAGIDSLMQEVEIVKAAEVFRNYRLDGKAALWVDDDPKNIEFPHKVLNNAGLYIEQSSSTIEALNSLSHNGFSVVVTNIERGGDQRAGIDLVKEIRNRWPGQPVIVFSRLTRLLQHNDELKQLSASTAADYSELLRVLAGIVTAGEVPIVRNRPPTGLNPLAGSVMAAEVGTLK